MPGEGRFTILLTAKDSVIRGDEKGLGNTIGFNGGHGIISENTSGNTINGNCIFDNAGESIETVKGGDIELTLVWSLRCRLCFGYRLPPTHSENVIVVRELE